MTEPRVNTAIPVDAQDDMRACALEVIRCYFWPDQAERAKWWAEDYGGTPDAEAALRLIRERLS